MALHLLVDQTNRRRHVRGRGRGKGQGQVAAGLLPDPPLEEPAPLLTGVEPEPEPEPPEGLLELSDELLLSEALELSDVLLLSELLLSDELELSDEGADGGGVVDELEPRLSVL